MTVIEVQLDEQTMAQMQREASRQQAKLETLIQELIKHLARAKAGESTLLELVVREPELMEELVTFANTARRITAPDPILALGNDPITIDVDDASENHDAYLYTR